MLKDYSGLEDSDDLNQQRRSSWNWWSRENCSGKVEKTKGSCVVPVYNWTQASLCGMELWHFQSTERDSKSAMKRSNCTLKTPSFHLQHLFTGTADCQNCQTCKMLVSIATLLAFTPHFFIFMLGRLSFKTKIFSLCFYFPLRNLGLGLLKRKSI